MVKKIRVIDEPVEETTEVTLETFYELAKTMDWKLWEMMQVMQRLEKKIQILDQSEDTDVE